MISLSSPKGAIQSWAYSEAYAEFKGDQQKATIASVGMGHGVDYLRSLPIGCSYEDSADFKQKLHDHIIKEIKADKALKPVGFLGAITFGWLLYTALSAIVSWIIQKLLDKKFGK